MMETITLSGVGGLGAILLAAVGKLFSKINDLEKEMANHRLHVAETYVSAALLKDFKEDVDKRFDRIEVLLNGRKP
jgi:hypothetical protein